ncbi:MAG: hypothetical protein FJZ64_02710, partial [Chlamydiae bacterium]|nr:hypothetical protein [Chlamydiota bacterium]
MNSGISLKEILDKEELDLTLTSDEMVAFLAFLLSEAKEPQPEGDIVFSLTRKDKSAPQHLKRFVEGISYSFVSHITSKTRRLLSEDSIRFVREMSWELKDLNLIKMVSQDFLQEHNSWPCLPMFWTYKILLKAASRASIPFVIHAQFLDQKDHGYKVRDEEVLVFKPVKEGSKVSYVFSQPLESDMHKPVLIIQGAVCLDSRGLFCKTKWKEKILKRPVMDIVLSGAADHKQYPNEDIELNVADSEYHHYKNLAVNEGFSIDGCVEKFS